MCDLLVTYGVPVLGSLSGLAILRGLFPEILVFIAQLSTYFAIPVIAIITLKMIQNGRSTTQEKAPGNDRLFSARAKADILHGLSAFFSKESHKILTQWFFDENALIKEDIHYGAFLECDAFLANCLDNKEAFTQCRQEVRGLREEVYCLWKDLGPYFRVVWTTWLTNYQRKEFITCAMIRASEFPNGDELRKFLLDFDCDSLCANNGKAFINYVKGTAVCDDRDINTPALSPKLENIFLGWDKANNTNDDISERKAVYLDCLRNRCRYSRDVFGCRVILIMLGIWQELAAPYIPEQVAKVKAHGFDNLYNGPFRALGSVVQQSPKTTAQKPAVNETSKKKKKSGGRGKKSRVSYNAKKQESKLRKSMAEEQVNQELCTEEANASVVATFIDQVEDGNVLPINLSQNNPITPTTYKTEIREIATTADEIAESTYDTVELPELTESTSRNEEDTKADSDMEAMSSVDTPEHCGSPQIHFVDIQGPVDNLSLQDILQQSYNVMDEKLELPELAPQTLEIHPTEAIDCKSGVTLNNQSDESEQDGGIQETGLAFFQKVTQLLENSRSANISRRNSDVDKESITVYNVDSQALNLTEDAISSSRRDSLGSSSSFEDTVRAMLTKSQRSSSPETSTTCSSICSSADEPEFQKPTKNENAIEIGQGPSELSCNVRDFDQSAHYKTPGSATLSGYYGNAEVPIELRHIVDYVPLSSLIFQCNTCCTRIMHEGSVLCPGCDVHSSTRFCSEECRYASGHHWMTCGKNLLPYAIDCPPRPYSGLLRSTAAMNAARYWQATLLHDYPGFDFCIFAEGLELNESPKILRAVVFHDQSLRDRFYAVYRRAHWDNDEFCVRILWRIVREWCKTCCFTDVTTELLSAQFKAQFGEGWKNSMDEYPQEDLPSEEEWLHIEEYLERKLWHEGFCGVKAVLPKFPQIGREPIVPPHIAKRVAIGGATPTGLHVWYIRGTE
ncbi:hypothetical protein BZA77DRAFT_364803 [Pyronema omphalodes]|nr:hypothetical protein BZA77DRAFT_364803 [Pyronema omphalodes]